MADSDLGRFVDVAPTDTTETLRRRTDNFSARYELRFSPNDFPRNAPPAVGEWARYFDGAAYNDFVRDELLRRRRMTVRAMELRVGDAVVIGERLYVVATLAAETTRVVVDLVDRLAPRCFPKMNLEDTMERNTAFAITIRYEYQPRELVTIARRA